MLSFTGRFGLPKNRQEPVRADEYASSHVAGIPLMFLVGWWVGMRPAIVVWLVYAVVDVAVLAGSGLTLRMGALVAVSLLTKLASVYLGALGARV